MSELEQKPTGLQAIALKVLQESKGKDKEDKKEDKKSDDDNDKDDDKKSANPFAKKGDKDSDKDDDDDDSDEKDDKKKSGNPFAKVKEDVVDEEAEDLAELGSTYSKPARVPQRMIKPEAAGRVAKIADKKGMGDKDVENVLFQQGNGRKSTTLVKSMRKEDIEEVEEEVEELDEISKKTAVDYMTKAAGTGRSDGVKLAAKKAFPDKKVLGGNAKVNATEEVEEIEEISKETVGSYAPKARKQYSDIYSKALKRNGNIDNKDYDTLKKREKGMSNADKRLNKEDIEDEVDQEGLNELSTKLLTRYANKAQRKANSHGEKGDKAEDKAMETDGRREPGKSKQAALSKQAGDEFNKEQKRQSGVNTAVSKLSDKAAGKIAPSIRFGADRDRKPNTAKIKATKEELEMAEYEEIDNLEETAAADSMKPAAKSIADPKALNSSKIGMMQSMMGMMGSMKKNDLLDFYNKVMSQHGPNKDWGVGDKSGSNQSSIDMKGSDAVASKGPKTRVPMPKLKEDIEELFDGQDDLTEEAKEAIATLFEAAVSASVITEVARLEEEYEARLEEELEAFNEDVSAKIDAYLDYVVESWMADNEVAIESALRNELMEEFMEGLKNLFAEHYIDVPQDKVDVLEALAEKVEALEAKLDESITENAELKTVLVEEQRTKIFESLASDLALTQQEKFADLVEGIEFDGNLQTYEKKLKIVKEQYFKQETATTSTNINEETFEGEETVVHNAQINRYLKAMQRTVK